jgi:hypothetical protein
MIPAFKIVMFLCAFMLSMQTLAENAERCRGELVTTPMPPKQRALYLKYVAIALKSAANKDHIIANQCLWINWPKRDGALVGELVDNFIALGERNPTIFISVASRLENDVQSLFGDLYLGFVAVSNEEAQTLEKLRVTWMYKLRLLKPKVNKEVEAKNTQLLIEHLTVIKVRVVD